jgi:hypothetical protein
MQFSLRGQFGSCYSHGGFEKQVDLLIDAYRVNKELHHLPDGVVGYQRCGSADAERCAAW